MKRAFIIMLVLSSALLLSACSVIEELGISEVVVKENITEYSNNAVMAEALSAYANFIRKNPYPCGSKDPEKELLIDNKLIKEYSEYYAKMAGTGGEKQNSPFIAYGQEVLKLEKYIDCDEFILYTRDIWEITQTIEYLVNDGRQFSSEFEYASAAETMSKASEKYSEMLRMAESVASAEPDMREMISVIRDLKASVQKEISAIEEGAIIEILNEEESYDDLMAQFHALTERADKYVDEIICIEENIAALYAKLKE